MIRLPSRNVQPSLLQSIKNPCAAGVLFFLLFVFANAVKTAIFGRLLTDEELFPSVHDFFSGFQGKLFFAFVVYMILTRPRRRYLFAAFYCLQTLYLFINLAYHFNLQGYLHVSQYAHLYSEALDLVTHSAVPWDTRLLFAVIDAPAFACVFALYPHFAAINKTTLFRPALVCAAMGLIVAMVRWSPFDFSRNRQCTTPTHQTLLW